MIRFKLNTPFAIYTYWMVIILWQTVRPVENRSLVDVLVKMGCFVALCIYGYNRKNVANTRGITVCTIIFFIFQILTHSLDSVNASTIVTSVFMFAQILVFLIFLRNATISDDELDTLGDWSITSSMIMCLYNVLFNTNRFLKLFTASSGAYGSECKSFLYSNHEFAIYISVAIIFIVWKLINNNYKMLRAIVFLVFMIVNLFSTYSRTAMIGCVGAIVVMMFYYNKKHFSVLCGIAIVLTIIILVNPQVNSFIFDKMLKGSYDSSGSLIDDGRANMYMEEMEFFKSGDIIQKLFGHGYVSGTVSGGHNAYLYILNIGGIVMFAFFLLVVICSFANSFKCIRYSRSVGSLCLGLQVFACLYMFAQTPILFFSTMDSYFITMIAVLIPLYCLNSQKYNYIRRRQMD